jgi:hypothetical protein
LNAKYIENKGLKCEKCPILWLLQWPYVAIVNTWTGNNAGSLITKRRNIMQKLTIKEMHEEFLSFAYSTLKLMEIEGAYIHVNSIEYIEDVCLFSAMYSKSKDLKDIERLPFQISSSRFVSYELEVDIKDVEEYCHQRSASFIHKEFFE